jgi:hypothetical protein
LSTPGRPEGGHRSGPHAGPPRTTGTPAPADPRHAAAAALRRLLLAAALLIPLAVGLGPAVQRLLLPVTVAVFESIAPDLRVRSLQAGTVDGERRVTAVVTLARTTVIGEKVLMPDPRGEATAFTPAGHAWIAPLVAALALAAWPARSRVEALGRLAGGLPVALLLLAADPAVMLAATVWQLMIDNVAPGTPVFLASLAGLLLGGGRIVLGLAAAALVIGVVHRLQRSAKG